MNNKGFTLIEVLAVIIILAVISMIAIPQIIGTTESAKKNLYGRQVDRIINGAKSWESEHIDLLPDNDNSGKSIKISILDLKKCGYLKKKEKKNPLNTEENMAEEIAIYYDYEYKQYLVAYCDFGNGDSSSEGYAKNYYKDNDLENAYQKCKNAVKLDSSKVTGGC